MRLVLAAVAGMLVAYVALPAQAQSDDERYSIMVPEKGAKPDAPEPWLAPKYHSPRGTRQHIEVPPPAETPSTHAAVPPQLYVPQTGRTLQNLPAPSAAGPRGAETYQDRAVRCAHQAGVYGSAAGDRTTYINSCINQ
jgi:hypothetical protein